MNSPLISVIIPIHNCGEYLIECLDSVVSQTLKDIEVIIIDDASTDASGKTIDAYAEADARFRVTHLPTSVGAGAARNMAMDKARGEYVAFMDGDDFYPSTDVLEKLYDHASEQKANICGGSLQYVNAEGRPCKRQLTQQNFSTQRWYSYEEYQYEGGFYRFLYLRDFLNSNRCRFPERSRMEDPLFCVSTMLAAGDIYGLPMLCYAYRKGHKRPIWNSQATREHLQGIRELLELSQKYGLETLHYQMAKNFQDSLYRRMPTMSMREKLAESYAMHSRIDWNFIRRQNRRQRVQVWFYKMLVASCVSGLITSIQNVSRGFSDATG